MGGPTPFSRNNKKKKYRNPTHQGVKKSACISHDSVRTRPHLARSRSRRFWDITASIQSKIKEDNLLLQLWISAQIDIYWHSWVNDANRKNSQLRFSWHSSSGRCGARAAWGPGPHRWNWKGSVMLHFGIQLFYMGISREVFMASTVYMKSLADLERRTQRNAKRKQFNYVKTSSSRRLEGERTRTRHCFQKTCIWYVIGRKRECKES